MLIIGNEILSGKTQDVNLQFLGIELAKLGVRVLEARILRDEEAAVVAAINEARTRYTYVFTTGGIGPTHDDITAQCVAKAFDRKLALDPEALKRLRHGGAELNRARRKMATVPEGATLIDNPLSGAPGFRVENVFVLAGIPSVARAMFSAVAKELATGQKIYSQSVDVYLREGDIAEPLARIAEDCADVEIGSYPFSKDGRYGANLVVRSTDPQRIQLVMGLILEAMREARAEIDLGPLV